MIEPGKYVINDRHKNVVMVRATHTETKYPKAWVSFWGDDDEGFIVSISSLTPIEDQKEAARRYVEQRSKKS